MNFLTAVVSDVSTFEYTPPQTNTVKSHERVSYKMAATVVHRLTGNVFFTPKVNQSRMAVFEKWLKENV